jgi:hypothetical protein
LNGTPLKGERNTPERGLHDCGIVLLALSALIGFGLGTFFWFAIAASSAGIAALSSAILHIQGFGAIPGIAIVVACLIVSQMAYLAASFDRVGYLRNKPTRNQVNVATRTSATRSNSNKGLHLRQ